MRPFRKTQHPLHALADIEIRNFMQTYQSWFPNLVFSNWGSNPDIGKCLFASPKHQNSSEANPPSYPMSNQTFFHVDKVARE